MIHFSLVILTPLLQVQILPAVEGAANSPASKTTSAEPPARALTVLGTRGERTGGVFHSLSYVDGGRQLLGAWYGTYEVWRDGRKVLHKNFDKAKAIPAPDGKTVAVVMEERKILLVDMKSGKEIRHFRGEAGPIAGVAWSPCSKLLAAGVGPTVFLWHAPTGKVRRVLTSDSLQHLALAFSPDGTKLAAGDHEFAQVWDVGAGAVLARLEDGFHGLRSPLAFSRDAKVLVGGCYEDYGNGRGRVSLRQWDVVTGKRIRDLQFGTFYSVAFTADENDVWAGADRYIYRWQLKSGKQVDKWLAHRGEVRTLAVSRDGTTLSSAGADLRLRSWNAATGAEQPATHGHVGSILAVAFSSDGALVISEGEDGTLRFWDAVSGKQLRSCPATAPKNRWAGFGLSNGALPSWQPISTLHGRLASSPDGRLLAVARKHEIVLREAATGATLAVFFPDQGNITCVAFARHGRMLVSGSDEGGLTVWDPTGRRQSAGLPPAKMSKEQLVAQATLLRGGDAVKAHQAIWTLASAGPDVVPLMEALLPRAGTAAKIKQSIADLGDPTFAVRAKAMKQLAEAADDAEPNLLEALANHPDVETRRRIELLLRNLQEGAIAKRAVQVRRALAVLEYSATQEARSLLERFAQAEPHDPCTKTVQAILMRWNMNQ